MKDGGALRNQPQENIPASVASASMRGAFNRTALQFSISASSHSLIRVLRNTLGFRFSLVAATQKMSHSLARRDVACNVLDAAGKT
jgi:hypothetical protein